MQEKYVVRGRIDEQWLAQLTGDAYDQFTYFLCGPNRFIKAMRSTLHAHAADPARVISEEFTPASGTSEIAASSVQRAAPRWTYGLTGGSLLLAVLFFMVLDLDRAIPHAQAASTQTTAASSSTASPNQDTATTSSGSSGTDSTVNGQANSNSSTLITPQTYQTPVTSVS